MRDSRVRVVRVGDVIYEVEDCSIEGGDRWGR
jgi:hypothetical protein